MPNALVDRSWPLLRHLTAAHVALYRRSGGRLGHKPPFAPPMLLLDHVGARSGIKRTSPLVYTHVGDDYVLVASKGGYPRHPAWLHNLRAHPDTTIHVGRHVVQVHAHVASDEERERLWPRCVATYGGFDGYQARAGRTIPLVILSPRT